MEHMSKTEILKALQPEAEIDTGRNSMGVNENFYDPIYLLRQAFKDEDVGLTSMDDMSEGTLNALLKVAKFAGDVFY